VSFCGLFGAHDEDNARSVRFGVRGAVDGGYQTTKGNITGFATRAGLDNLLVKFFLCRTAGLPIGWTKEPPVLTADRSGPTVPRPEEPMRASRFSDEQIVAALRQAEAGTPVVDIVRRPGVTETTFSRWKRRFGDFRVTEIRELKQLRDENRQLRSLVAELSLDKTILREALTRTW